MALNHILILPCCHSKCSYIEVIVESPLAHGLPDAATFSRHDLGYITSINGRMAAYENVSPKSLFHLKTRIRSSFRGVDLEIFTGSYSRELRFCTFADSGSALSGDFEDLSPREDLEILYFWWTLTNYLQERT
ncbi:hypothetical protein V1477_007933 [Vespula maculifrons]|uniref:Uncharacterized protein n=1 Tax=Vespula maculifrons TaxID=7453 RepID=A0ABD2CG48_VESMC